MHKGKSTDALLIRVGNEARLIRAALVLMVLSSTAATYQTPNFIVDAPTAEIAEQCGKTAEYYRETLAVAWLGKKMPRWYKPCTLSVKVGQIGAGGATTFAFDRGEVFGWRMNVQGSLERILDSVIPHEVSHTVFASHFRRPLPRWADEGAATLIEHESERHRQYLLLKQVWNTQRRIPLRKLLAIKDYPRDMQDVLTLYAEGYSLADFLVQAGGKTRYLDFLNTAHQNGWDRAIEEHYSLGGVDDLEGRWTNWVMAGSPRINIPEGSQLAANEKPAPRQPAENQADGFERPVIRAQTPDSAPSKPRQVAVSSPRTIAPPTAPPTQAVALPKTAEARSESPGWRRLRQDQLQEIPADFVNPANAPAQVESPVLSAEASSTTNAVTSNVTPAGHERQPNTGWKEAPANRPRDSAAPPEAAPSNEPLFRFELEGSSSSRNEFQPPPGGQASAVGRSPNWSEFPRTRTNRGPAPLDQASERPVSP